MTVHPNTVENIKLTPTHCICKIGGNTAPYLGNVFFITNT